MPWNHYSSKCKEVFYLSRFKHLSNAEIANRLNISIRTVETHISHALRHLRSNLQIVPSVVFVFVALMLSKS